MNPITHTAGPWTWRAQGDANEYVLLTGDGKRWLIAMRHNGELMPAKQEANCRLLAAAPDYHAAALKVIEETRLLGPTSRAHIGGLLNAIRDLRAAHIKATGGTP